MTTVAQFQRSSNGLAQTFDTVFPGAPTEGNLLIGALCHDESAVTDGADLVSAGWRRMATFSADLTPTLRISVFAKIAGAAESDTLSWDIGEANRRSHGWAVELEDLPDFYAGVQQEDAADFVSDSDTSTATLTVTEALNITPFRVGITVAMAGGASPTPPTFDVSVILVDNWNSNFKATAIGFSDPEQVIQPTATWGSARDAVMISAKVGIDPAGANVLRHSSFQVTKVSN